MEGSVAASSGQVQDALKRTVATQLIQLKQRCAERFIARSGTGKSVVTCNLFCVYI